MALDQRPEAPDRQLVAVNFGVGPDRRRAGRLVDQGHLPERVAGSELADFLAVDEYGHVAALDHDERAAGLTLLGDRLAGRIRPLDELVGEPLQKGVVGVREERDTANQFGAGSRHGADPTTRGRNVRAPVEPGPLPCAVAPAFSRWWPQRRSPVLRPPGLPHRTSLRYSSRSFNGVTTAAPSTESRAPRRGVRRSASSAVTISRRTEWPAPTRAGSSEAGPVTSSATDFSGAVGAAGTSPSCNSSSGEAASSSRSTAPLGRSPRLPW